MKNMFNEIDNNLDQVNHQINLTATKCEARGVMTTNGDFWGLEIMGTTGKTIDVIPQVPKSSHYLPPRPVMLENLSPYKVYPGVFCTLDLIWISELPLDVSQLERFL